MRCGRKGGGGTERRDFDANPLSDAFRQTRPTVKRITSANGDRGRHKNGKRLLGLLLVHISTSITPSCQYSHCLFQVPVAALCIYLLLLHLLSPSFFISACLPACLPVLTEPSPSPVAATTTTVVLYSRFSCSAPHLITPRLTLLRPAAPWSLLGILDITCDLPLHRSSWFGVEPPEQTTLNPILPSPPAVALPRTLPRPNSTPLPGPFVPVGPPCQSTVLISLATSAAICSVLPTIPQRASLPTVHLPNTFVLLFLLLFFLTLVHSTHFFSSLLACFFFLLLLLLPRRSPSTSVQRFAPRHCATSHQSPWSTTPRNHLPASNNSLTDIPTTSQLLVSIPQSHSLAAIR